MIFNAIPEAKFVFLEFVKALVPVFCPPELAIIVDIKFSAILPVAYCAQSLRLVALQACLLRALLIATLFATEIVARVVFQFLRETFFSFLAAGARPIIRKRAVILAVGYVQFDTDKICKAQVFAIVLLLARGEANFISLFCKIFLIVVIFHALPKAKSLLMPIETLTFQSVILDFVETQ